jgi:hypothetical protein
VSPIHALVDHWLSILKYKVGDVAICSIITRLAVSLSYLKVPLWILLLHIDKFMDMNIFIMRIL